MPLAYYDNANARYNAVKAIGAAATGGRHAARTLTSPAIMQLLKTPPDGTARTVEVIMVEDRQAAPPGVNPLLLEAAERDWMQ
jgi:hypothetical protein